MKYNTIHSLGSRCQNSDILKKYNYREFAGFFDFMNTQDVYKINHIIHDDFKAILNKDNNVALVCNQLTIDPETGAMLPTSVRTSNKTYNIDYNNIHTAIFPHHDLTSEKDYNHFVKCKERFKKLINYNVLFNYTFNTWENNISVSDMETMVNSLKEIHGFKNFKVCFIGLRKDQVIGYRLVQTNEFYDVWEQSISHNSFTGGAFADDASNDNFMKIIKSYDIDNNRITKEEIDK